MNEERGLSCLACRHSGYFVGTWRDAVVDLRILAFLDAVGFQDAFERTSVVVSHQEGIWEDLDMDVEVDRAVDAMHEERVFRVIDLDWRLSRLAEHLDAMACAALELLLDA